MSYCINPNCSNRLNPDNLESCQTCSTKLLINERYQVVQPLRVGQLYNSEVFEVKDFNEQGTLKVLKSLAIKPNNSKLNELFEKEAQALIWLSSEWQKHPGIPEVKPDAYFIFGLGNGFRKLQCLVMEKIEGQNLEQWLEENQPISQDKALNWLQQLVEILDKVHRQGLWHRDIKPSNIMLKPDGQLVLIDFGSVGIGPTIIISAEYTAPEQIKGQTVLQSDFYALGRTFVYLLTGKRPNELPKTSATGQLIWGDIASNISLNLASLIDDLIARLPENRPQNTEVILQRIRDIKNGAGTRIAKATPKFQVYLKVRAWRIGAAIVLFGVITTTAFQLIPCSFLGNFKSCPVPYGDNLSFGEEILIPGSANSEKQGGVKAFKQGNYDKAVNLLQEARSSDKTDPETLIYLNNAQIEAQKAQAYTIAVAAPLKTSQEALNSGLEMLRGVAQAQAEFNQRRNGAAGIKVLIGDDANRADQAKQIAKSLVNQEGVLAVVGHFTSDLTIAAGDVYQQNQLVFVSPTSTSEDLSAVWKSYNPNFFFRTVPSDRFTAQALAKYLPQQANQETTAVFYNSSSKYSNSLLKEFRSSFQVTGGTIVDEVDLYTANINSRQAIDRAGKKEAKVLVLFPNSESQILNKAIKLIKANQCRYFMVGGDTVYSPEIQEIVGKEAANCLVVAVPWHSMDSPDKDFPQAAEKLWAGKVSWRTALAYDATRALIAAIETQSKPSRITVRQILAAPNFQATGATGMIRFQNGDRNEANIKLVKLVLDKQDNPTFIPLQKTP